MNAIRFLVCVAVSISLAGSGSAAEPRLEWAFETKGKIYASPVLADLDNDGTIEVIVCASRDRQVICLNGQGELRWGYSIHDSSTDGIQSTPSVADFDGDGKQEVFFITAGGTLGCLDCQGQLLWSTSVDDKVDYSAPVLGDIDGDGALNIVFGSESGTLYCYDDVGTKLWHYQGKGQVRGIPALTFHEPSGSMRVYATFGEGESVCLNAEGDAVWTHHEPSARNERRSGPALGDFDGDGALEVVLATDDCQVIVRDAFTGVEKWRWKAAHRVDQTHSFALVDFDGTGKLDIVLGDGTGLGGPGNVYRLRDGKSLWTTDVGGGVVQGPSVGDVDGDGDLEILACSRSKRMVCLSSTGEEEWSWPTQAGSLTTPALGDIDGDGKVEIVFTSKDRFVYCVTVDGGYKAEALPWPMMSGNPQLTGQVGGKPFIPAPAPQETAAKQDSLVVEQFGPLRAGDNTVRISFINAAPRPRNLMLLADVLRPDGSRISQTTSGRLGALEGKTDFFDFHTVFTTRADAAQTYRLSVRLVDAGTGRTLAEEQRSLVLDCWAEEKREWESLVKGAFSAIQALPSETVKARALGALDTATEGAPGRFKEACLSLYALASDRERHAVIEDVRGRLARMRVLLARLQASRQTPGSGAEFAVVPDTTMRKVFRDEPYALGTNGTGLATLSLAGNESESVQIVVVPLWRDLKEVQTRVGALKRVGGQGAIPASAVQVRPVGYIEIGPPEYNWYVEKRGWYPDVLWHDQAVDVPASQCAQPFFVTVRATAETPAGDYEGTISVEAAGCPAVAIPLKVHVWNFALSKETHLKTSCWMSEGNIQRFYKLDGRMPFEMRKRFYDFHLDHRMSPVKDFPLNGGEMLEDFDYLMAKGQNAMFIGVPEYLEPDNRADYAADLKSTWDLLESKGWNDATLFYTRDEVAVVGRHVIPKVVEMNDWIHTIIPGWPRLQTSAPEQALFGGIDIWCPTIDHFDPAVLRDRMTKDERLWFYTVWGRPGIMIEFPATDYRLMFWECWKYGAEGFLYWGTTHWALNMTTDARWPDIPWVPYNSQPGHNGCGYLIYPGPDGTPMASIRMDLARDGIEDYEYFHLLKRLLEQGGDRIPKDLTDRAKARLAIDPAVVTDHKTYTEDPDLLLDARAELAAVIEAVSRVVKP